MFRHLRTKLTLFYGGLFGLVLIAIASLLTPLLSSFAMQSARSEMQATVGAFERIKTVQLDQLRQNTSIAASDFGFRSAAALGEQDPFTLQSALANLQGRLGSDKTFFVRPDGSAVTHNSVEEVASPVSTERLQIDEAAFGVMVLDGAAVQAVAVPVLAPDTVGWLVVTKALDTADMRDLLLLSVIDIQAEVQFFDGSLWHTVASSRSVPDEARETEVIAEYLTLAAIDDSMVRLQLSYPRALALKPARDLSMILLEVGLAGLLFLSLAGWLLARSITRPLAALEYAACDVQRGEYVAVTVESEDEVGRLAKGFNLMVRAIDERTKTITHLALHDRETDLPNREHLDRELRRLGRKDDVHVAVFRIDQFARMRAAIGFRHASDLVRALGERLAGCNPATLPVRLSADLIGAGFRAGSPDEAKAWIAGALDTLKAPVAIDGHPVDISVTVGYALAVGSTPNGLDAVECATIAVDQARDARKTAAIFDAEAYGDPVANLSLMGELVEALQAGDIFVVYQPKLNLRTNQVTSAEALVRWRHAQRGMVRPDIFVEMAEETGHIRALTEFVLARAVEDQAALAADGHDLTISVNLSGRLLGDESFQGFAESLLARCASSICLEITETAVMDDPETAILQLEAFRHMGASISIDDFGSGLSSLAYLKMLPAQELKIDRSLLQGLADSSRDAFLIKSTIDLGHGLGMSVVVEGIEDAMALSILRGLGSDYAQGYYICRPLERDALAAFLDQEDRKITDTERLTA